MENIISTDSAACVNFFGWGKILTKTYVFFVKNNNWSLTTPHMRPHRGGKHGGCRNVPVLWWVIGWENDMGARGAFVLECGIPFARSQIDRDDATPGGKNILKNILKFFWWFSWPEDDMAGRQSTGPFRCGCRSAGKRCPRRAAAACAYCGVWQI